MEYLEGRFGSEWLFWYSDWNTKDAMFPKFSSGRAEHRLSGHQKLR